MTDDVDTRRRRALYRAMHRGTKEMDHILSRYAEARLAGMAELELAGFERFLALPDPLLQGWVLGAQMPEAGEFSALVADMRALHGLPATA